MRTHFPLPHFPLPPSQPLQLYFFEIILAWALDLDVIRGHSHRLNSGIDLAGGILLL